VKPVEVFDRQREWDALEGFCAVDRPPWLGIVSGRRRQGTTLLVEAATRARGGLYFCAADQAPQQNLADLAAACRAWSGGELPVAFASWDEGLGAVLDLASRRKVPVAFDEVGYLIHRFAAFPSLLQRQLDARRAGGCPVLLCGSATSVLANLTGANQPLRGRARLELVVHPFDARTARQFWQADDAEMAVALWALLGGTPAYRQWCPAGPPRRRRDLPTWVADHLLDVTSPLHREGRTVQLEADELTDRTAHLPVLAAIARGASTRTSIAAATGRGVGSLAPSLDTLRATGLVAAASDPLHDRRVRYDVADPIVRTWHEVIEPVERRLVHGEGRRIVEDLVPRLQRVVAVAWEQLVRDWVDRWAPAELLGGPATAVGPSAADSRQAMDSPGNQIDVVAVDRQASGRRLVRLLGEAKHRTRPAGASEIERLEALRERLGDADTRLLLASTAGFNAELERVARRRGDLVLVDPARLYER
jgi:hypothetical protein